MAIESEGNHQDKKRNEDGDLEMADISLLNHPEEDDSTHDAQGEARSWYSAHGRGFTFNGRQTETQEAPSHIEKGALISLLASGNSLYWNAVPPKILLHCLPAALLSTTELLGLV